MQIAIVLYSGMTTLDAVGPYEVLRFIPNADVRFVSREPGPVITDAGVLVLGPLTLTPILQHPISW